MKLNISYPATGCQKLIDIDDERKLRVFYDKRLAAEVSAESLGDEWKGYIVRISGGNDKQGFPMKQGVMTNGRVKLLLSDGHSCFRIRRSGERRRKSVRGCIVDANLSVLSLVIIKKGEQEIPGLTDKTVPRRLGPKRAMKIRKLFNLEKNDDVRQYVVRRPLPVKEGKEGKKTHTKAPKIQRLVTSLVLQRKRHRLAVKRRRSIKKREDLAEYQKLLAQRMKEAKEKKMERRRSASQSKSSVSRTESASMASPKAETQKPAKPAKAAKPVSADAKSTAAKKPAAPAKSAAPASSAAKPAAATAKPVATPTKQAAAPAQAKPAAGKSKGGKPKEEDKSKGKSSKK